MKKVLVIGGAIVWFLGVLANIAQIGQWLESSNRLPIWLTAISHIPPTLLSAIVSLAILLILGYGLIRVIRLEQSWEATNRLRQEEYRLWIRDREREIQTRCASEYQGLDRKIESLYNPARQAINDFHAAYDRRLDDTEKVVVEGAQWIAYSIGNKQLRVTGDATTFLENCTET